MITPELEDELLRQKDFREICNFQGRFNHYMLTHRFDKIFDMFAKKYPVTIEMADSGVYQGIEGVKKLFGILGEKYGFPGSLGLHMLVTPVVEISKDRQTAQGMWQSFGCNTYQGEFGLFAMWQAGKYSIKFVKEDGEWKYGDFRWYVIFRTPYEDGWVKKPLISGLHKEGSPSIGDLYKPFDPYGDNEFLPLPPEPEK